MATNGSYGFILNGTKILTYNHHSSNPEFLGKTIVRFIKLVNKTNDWEKLKEKITNIKLVTLNDIASPEDILMYKEYADLAVSTKKIDDWYVLLNKLQDGRILFGIMSDIIHHFYLDNTEREYTYIIDLDLGKFTMYKNGVITNKYNLKDIVENFKLN